ncbi:MAG: DinB family protein [Actinomycetales bacterium]
MITPDTKDWTWVLEEPCSECGYDATDVEPARVGERVRTSLPRWQQALTRADAAERPSEDVWSPLEYACHVRDVFTIFDGRLQQMLTVDHPEFANWDQDATAVDGRYGEQDPSQVSVELAAAGSSIAARFDGVSGLQWDRTASRSDGARFTTASFSRYFLHDIEHHLHDVGA